MSFRFLVASATVAASLAVLPGQPPAEGMSCAPGPPRTMAGAVPVVAHASPVAQETSIRWTRLSRRIVFGDVAALEGQVVTEDGAVGGAEVDLYSRTSAARDWMHVASTTSDDDTGVFAFGCLYPRRTTEFRVVHEGSLLLGRSSGDRTVGVARLMPDDMEQVGGSRFVFRGSVAPRYDGFVTLERRTCAECAWRDVEVTRTRESRWRFAIDVSGLDGVVAYRAAIAADHRFARSLSDRTWRITVR